MSNLDALLGRYTVVSVDSRDIKVYRLSIKGLMALNRLIAKTIGPITDIPPDISASIFLTALSGAEQEVIDILKDVLRCDEATILSLTHEEILAVINTVIEQENIQKLVNDFFVTLEKLKQKIESNLNG